MKVKKLLSTFAALAIAASSFAGLGISANAYTSSDNTVAVDVLHTAHSQWGSNTPAEATMDNATEYFNRDVDTGWAACAYMQFDTSSIADDRVIEANLDFNATSGKTYESDLYYLTADTTDLSNLTADKNARFTSARTWICKVASVSGGVNVVKDVTAAVKARAAADQVTFMITGNAGGASITGKAADTGAPVLNVTYGNIITFNVTKGGAAVADVPIVIGDNTYTTDSAGTATALLAPGSYDYSIAQTSEYNTTSGTADITSGDATVNVTLKENTATPATITVNYQDASGNKIKDATTVSGFVGQEYTLADDAEERNDFPYTKDGIVYTATLNTSLSNLTVKPAAATGSELVLKFDLTENTYATTITTAPYAEVKITGTQKSDSAAVNKTIYSDASGKAVADLKMGTYSAAITKGGYNNGSVASFELTEAVSTDCQLTLMDSNVLYYEDFNTVPSDLGNWNANAQGDSWNIQSYSGGLRFAGTGNTRSATKQGLNVTTNDNYTISAQYQFNKPGSSSSGVRDVTLSFSDGDSNGGKMIFGFGIVETAAGTNKYTIKVYSNETPLSINKYTSSETKTNAIDLVASENVDNYLSGTVTANVDTANKKVIVTLKSTSGEVSKELTYEPVKTNKVAQLRMTAQKGGWVKIDDLKISNNPVISSVAIAAAAGDTLEVAEPADGQELTKVTAADDTTYGAIKGDMQLTTVYIKVANPVNGKAPALTVGTDTYKATYAGIKDYNGYYVYQILAKDAINLATTAYTVTYDGAADYSFTPVE